MKEPKVMKEIHKIRENMSRLSNKEFNKRMEKARDEYKKMMKV